MTEYIKILNTGTLTGLGTFKGSISKRIYKKADIQLTNATYKHHVTLIYENYETIHLSSNNSSRLEWKDSTEEKYNIQQGITSTTKQTENLNYLIPFLTFNNIT